MEEKEVKYCKRCNRELKSIESKEIGFGPVCLKKVQAMQKQQRLFEMNGNKQLTMFKDIDTFTKDN